MEDFVALCKRGDLGEVRGAVERGVDVNSEDTVGWSGLSMAVCCDHNHVVEWLLQQPAIDVGRRDSYGRTALNWAVAGNNPALLSLLLAHPTADPTGRNDDGMTPLEYCRWGTGRQVRLSSDLYRSCGGRPECLRIMEEDERRRQGGRQGGARAAGVGSSGNR